MSTLSIYAELEVMCCFSIYGRKCYYFPAHVELVM